MSTDRLAVVREFLKVPKQPETEAEHRDFHEGIRRADEIATKISAGGDADLLVRSELLSNPEFLVRGILFRLAEKAGEGLKVFGGMGR